MQNSCSLLLILVSLSTLDSSNSVTTPNPLEHLKDTDDRTIADLLSSKVRIFCWILTNRHQPAIDIVKSTWASHCNKFVFVSDTEDLSVPIINVKSGHGAYYQQHLWAWTKSTFQYIYKHEVDNFDFFLKADDASFMVLENLRLMLRHVNASSPILFGRRVKTESKAYASMGSMMGAAGFVISREGLRRMVERGFGIHHHCRNDKSLSSNDLISNCAWAVGVVPGDSRDSLGRERFHPYSLHRQLNEVASDKSWLWANNFYPMKQGLECCSDTTVSFHDINEVHMQVMQFCAYHWHPIGIIQDLDDMKSVLSELSNDQDQQTKTIRLTSDEDYTGVLQEIIKGLEKRLREVTEEVNKIRKQAEGD